MQAARDMRFAEADVTEYQDLVKQFSARAQ
jgi:hypothetical protein